MSDLSIPLEQDYLRIAAHDYQSVALNYSLAESIIQIVMDRLECNQHEQAGLMVAMELLSRAGNDLDSALKRA